MNEAKKIVPGAVAVQELVTFDVVASRCAAVVQMRANHAIEGIKPDFQDLALQRRYAAGKIGIPEMLEHARLYATSFMGMRRPFDPSSTVVH